MEKESYKLITEAFREEIGFIEGREKDIIKHFAYVISQRLSAQDNKFDNAQFIKDCGINS